MANAKPATRTAAVVTAGMSATCPQAHLCFTSVRLEFIKGFTVLILGFQSSFGSLLVAEVRNAASIHISRPVPHAWTPAQILTTRNLASFVGRHEGRVGAGRVTIPTCTVTVDHGPMAAIVLYDDCVFLVWS